jgi:hypothetical protein
MSALKKFTRPEVPAELVATSITISKDQKNFLDSRNLNLSKIVRDCIQKMILKTKNKETL